MVKSNVFSSVIGISNLVQLVCLILCLGINHRTFLNPALLYVLIHSGPPFLGTCLPGCVPNQPENLSTETTSSVFLASPPPTLLVPGAWGALHMLHKSLSHPFASPILFYMG